MTRRLLLAVLVCAAVVRIWQLGTVPLGLHGDEASTGFDARQVLAEGWIGPYAYPSGLGQPTGPVYFTAVVEQARAGAILFRAGRVPPLADPDQPG